MDAQTIRKKYLEFFKDRGHIIVPRSNLVPQEDATTLFTGSGMQPMVPYLLGEEHPEGTRIADSQTCLRSEDIEEVGNNRHTTFFEMLGNWSLGDYFKAEQLPWLFEFLVDIVGLDPSKLYATCFIGDDEFGIPKDSEAAEIWQELYDAKGIDNKIIDIGSETDGYQKGMQGGRIFYYDGSKNWWSRGGGPASKTPVGDPCGPDSEVFYDFGTPHDEKWGAKCHPNCDCGRFMEIGNSVFMAYKRTDKGFEKLPKPNVDFGAGLERIAAAAIGSNDMFDISLLRPIIDKLSALSGKEYNQHKEAMRVIADHLRGALWLAVDGIVPSNNEQGYVMRRLMRRAIRYGLELGIETDFCSQIVPTVVELYRADFPEVAEQKQIILDVFNKEEKIFRQTLRKGDKFLHKKLETLYDKAKPGGSGSFSLPKSEVLGDLLFNMYDTHGYPFELGLEILNKKIDELSKGHYLAIRDPWPQDIKKQFDKNLEEQRKRSRTATQGQFKGGLGGHSDIHKKYHTATHLMYKALRMVLGDHVVQRGSNITEERLRFDFSHPEKVTPEQQADIERIVNEQIAKDLPMTWKERDTKNALATGVLGAFGDKYGKSVKVYTAGDPDGDWFSQEICGGPHVEHTGQLSEGGKKFKIKKEEASSAGVRRIKAVLS